MTSQNESAVPREKPPHVIIIMADQLRADFIGEHTPNIRALMEDGTSFSRAYCASPLCVPSRGAFFTGRTPNRNGSLINPWRKQDEAHGYVRPEIPTLYSLMEERWDSWHAGKQHLYQKGKLDEDPSSGTHWLGARKMQDYGEFVRAAGVRPPGGAKFRGLVPEMTGGRVTHPRWYSIPATGRYEHGFEYFFDGYINSRGIEAIEKRDRTKPFLLNLMYLAPHPPLEIPEPWYSRVEQVELSDNVARWDTGQSPLQLYNLPGFVGAGYTREDWREIWRVYAGLVGLLDDAVGRILERLKEEGIYDDSLILFTADHGEMLGSHCLWQKMCMYEESTHVPMSLKLPRGQRQVKTSDALVSHLDVLPTLCDFLDLDDPGDLSGVSLRGVIEGDAPLQREHIFIQADGNGARGNFQRCVVGKNHKLIVDLFKDEIFFELYDVIEDPRESVNLAWEREDLVRPMLETLTAEMRAGDDLLEIPGGAYERFCTDYAELRPERA